MNGIKKTKKLTRLKGFEILKRLRGAGTVI